MKKYSSEIKHTVLEVQTVAAVEHMVVLELLVCYNFAHLFGWLADQQHMQE